MKRVVFYSLCGPAGVVDERYQLQIGNSIASLREHNDRVPVVLFAYGEIPTPLRHQVEELGVEVRDAGLYEQALDECLPGARAPLARYPTLHRWLSLRDLARTDVDQILYLDCDTYFFGDVEQLFDTHAELDWCAREEPYSQRSAYGYDPGYLDEPALYDLARSEGAAPIMPCNIGVVLMNNRVARQISGKLDLLLTYVWRFMLWMKDHPVAEGDLGDDLRRLVAATALQLPGSRPLAYPAARYWIMDQVAIWLTLGTVPNLRQGFFSRDEVLQNGEFMQRAPGDEWILCHYYSNTMVPFFQWIEAQNDAP